MLANSRSGPSFAAVAMLLILMILRSQMCYSAALVPYRTCSHKKERAWRPYPYHHGKSVADGGNDRCEFPVMLPLNYASQRLQRFPPALSWRKHTCELNSGGITKGNRPGQQMSDDDVTKIEGQGQANRRTSDDGISYHVPTTTNLAEDNRRKFLIKTFLTSVGVSSLALATTFSGGDAASADFFSRKNMDVDVESFAVTGGEGSGVAGAASKTMTIEDCLLDLLPVRKPVFNRLRTMIDRILPSQQNVTEPEIEGGDKAWKLVNKNCQAALQYLDKYRGKLEPAFDLDDENTILQILKNEKFEQLLESLRQDLETMLQYSLLRTKVKELYSIQKSSKLILAELGELQVSDFPYDVPTEGRYSTLPRLLGRAKVTFTIKRKRRLPRMDSSSSSQPNVGNVTIIADGYAAPLTAGNFVDLAARNFYTGLPVKNLKKRFGGVETKSSKTGKRVAEDRLSSSSPPTVKKMMENTITSIPGQLESIPGKLESAALQIVGLEEDESSANATPVPVLGSFQEGFIDPLTGKPRRIPLELVKIDRSSQSGGVAPSLIYSLDDAPSVAVRERAEKFAGPMLTFDIPGLVALNHPDKNVNGGSSEFFSLASAKSVSPDRLGEINGQYAPFGYIVEGLDIMQSLEPGDEITATYLDDWGVMNLVKIRGSIFDEVMRSKDDDKDDDE